jgi:hypothetical protein
MGEEKKDNGGCAKVGTIAIILLLLLPLWGLSGMMHGESFMDGIRESASAIVIIIAVIAIGYVILNAFNK